MSVALMALANPLRLALSTFHPPDISIATDFKVVIIKCLRGLSGHSIDSYQQVTPLIGVASNDQQQQSIRLEYKNLERGSS